MSIIDTLVIDRTRADVDARNDKGVYQHTDMVRVGEAVAYIRDLFRSYGYSITVDPRTDWTEIDIPRRADLVKYISDVAAVGRVVVFSADPPDLPGTMRGFTFETANNIEKFLYQLGLAAERIPGTWFELGQIESGVAYQ